jgi:hypothetical protein
LDITEITTNNNIYKLELRNIIMRKLQSLLSVPYKGEGAPKNRIFFGQLLVSDQKMVARNSVVFPSADLEITGTLFQNNAIPNLEFAKEVANAVLIQAEMNEVGLDYTPNGDQFVTRTDGNEHVLEFEGNIAAYLKLPESEANSLLVSFREANEEDLRSAIPEVKMMPSHVLTLSVDASGPGEFGDDGFWKQLANNLFCGLSEPDPERGREGHPDLKMAIVFGCNEAYQVIPMEKNALFGSP